MDFMDGGYLQHRLVFGYPAHSAGIAASVALELQGGHVLMGCLLCLHPQECLRQGAEQGWEGEDGTFQVSGADPALVPHCSPGPGGKNCRGASVEHTVCENLPCPKGVPSFRDQQCQAHDRYTNKKKSLLTAVIVDGEFLHLPLSFLTVLLLQLLICRAPLVVRRLQ